MSTAKLPPPSPEEKSALQAIITNAGEAQNWQQAQVLGMLREAHTLLCAGDWEQALETARKATVKERTHELSWGVALRYHETLNGIYEGDAPKLRAHAENNAALKQSLREELKHASHQKVTRVSEGVREPRNATAEEMRTTRVHSHEDAGRAVVESAVLAPLVHTSKRDAATVEPHAASPVPERTPEATPEHSEAVPESHDGEGQARDSEGVAPTTKRRLHPWEIRIIREKGVIASQEYLAGMQKGRLQDAMTGTRQLSFDAIEKVLSLTKIQIHKATLDIKQAAQRRRAQSKRATMQKRRELAATLETPPKPKRQPGEELTKLDAEISRLRIQLETLEALRSRWAGEAR